jgi:hypothetical protein
MATTLLATCMAALGLATSASAGWGMDYVGASPGVYARTGPTPYTSQFSFYRTVGGANYQYSWYVFTAGGTYQGGKTGVNDPHDTWGPAGWNYRYWKFYNGAPGVQGFDVYWTTP